MKKIIMSALLVTGSCTGVFAQKPEIITSNKEGWHKIGETMVDFKKETDELMVMGANRFEAVKIKVDKEPINLTSFEIYFDNGDKQMVSIGQEIKSPGETKVIELNGGERTIKKVIFSYKTMPNYKDKKARLELWGLKSGTKKSASK